MRISEVIAELEQKNQNVDPLQVAKWLDKLDGHIYNNLVLGHEGYNKIKKEEYAKGDTVNMDAELIAPPPYDEMYIHYLEAQSFYRDGDYERYGISMSLYNAARSDFDGYWINTHSLIQPRVKRRASL